VLEVHIDKGMKSGEQITFKGESDQTPGLEPGDVVIAIEQKPHEYFQRRGNDLVMEQEIDLLTALGGGEFTVVHLDERAIKVTIKPGEVIKPDHLKRISGQGMPSYRHHELGDLYIKFNVTFPDSIPPHLIAGLESALPARTPAKPVAKGLHVDEVELSEPSDRQKQAIPTDDDMDEDDEGGQGGGPGVQCAQRESSGFPKCRTRNSALTYLRALSPRLQNERLLDDSLRFSLSHFYSRPPSSYRSSRITYARTHAIIFPFLGQAKQASKQRASF
jgi:DnaJ family protein A protein 2